MIRAVVWCCRWDAKPDNQFGHSFPKTFHAPAHPTFWFLIGMLFVISINWSSFKEHFGFTLMPPLVQVILGRSYCRYLFPDPVKKHQVHFLVKEKDVVEKVLESNSRF